MLRPTMLRYVALTCYDRLAGALMRTLVTLGNFTPFRTRVDLRTLFLLVIFKRAHCIQI